MFDVLVIVAVVAAVWWWQRRPRQARHARGTGGEVSLLLYDDLPPIGAFDPIPDEHELDEYISSGLESLTSYLTGRDQTA